MAAINESMALPASMSAGAMANGLQKRSWRWLIMVQCGGLWKPSANLLWPTHYDMAINRLILMIQWKSVVLMMMAAMPFSLFSVETSRSLGPFIYSALIERGIVCSYCSPIYDWLSVTSRWPYSWYHWWWKWLLYSDDRICYAMISVTLNLSPVSMSSMSVFNQCQWK